MNPLFACSRCFSRHPFEEIFTSSTNEQLCRECRGAVMKCSYCRAEFQSFMSKGSISNICKKCQHNVKQYGKPSACGLCKVYAAFANEKCQRCLNSEHKYGAPVKCEICLQNCAFDREDHKVDGKLHCWLCKLSYKRALAKAKRADPEKFRSRKRSSHESSTKPSSNSTGMSMSNNSVSASMSRPDSKQRPTQLLDIPEKIAKSGSNGMHDLSNSSEHVVQITQLKETIVSLNKRLQQKDNQLLQKDKEITELKGKHFTLENEMRVKMKDQEKLYEVKIDILNKKISNQTVEIATLSRSTKRSAIKDSIIKEKEGSGTDSPLTN